MNIPNRETVTAARALRRTCLLLLAAAVGGWAGDAPAPASAESVVARMMSASRDRDTKLREYTSVRVYSMVNKRFHTSASMKIRLDYRAPEDKKYEVLEETGPGPIREKVFKRMLKSEMTTEARVTRISPDNYTFTLAGEESISGRRHFILEAEPRTKHPLLFRGRIWVDADDYAIARIEGAPAQNPSFLLRKTRFVHRYGKIDGHWMALANESESDVLMFGRTEVKIEYSDYQINRQRF